MVYINDIKDKAKERGYTFQIANLDYSEMYFKKGDLILLVRPKGKMFSFRYDVSDEVSVSNVDMCSFFDDDHFKRTEEDFRKYLPREVDTFYQSWNYLNNLEMVNYNGLSRLKDCLNVEVIKIDPAIDAINIEDSSMNTKVKVRLELSEIVYDEELKKTILLDDIDFGCWGDTYEEAIIEMANICKAKGCKEIPIVDVTDVSIKELEDLYNNQSH